jgi:hypothetical protein
MNKVIIVVGTRGTGKTDFLKNQIASSKLRKKLIIDTFDSAVWHNMETWNNPNGENFPIPSLDIDLLNRWKEGIYRLYGSDTNAIMKAIQENVLNALLIFEDATKYIGSKLSDDVRKFVLDSKQKNLNIIFTFHSLMSVPNDLIRIADYLTIFKTNESFNSGLKSKYPWSFVQEAHEKIKNDKNRFANITLSISG